MKTNYYVANNQGIIAGHDLDRDHAEAVLSKQIEQDPRNDAEWEIMQAETKGVDNFVNNL